MKKASSLAALRLWIPFPLFYNLLFWVFSSISLGSTNLTTKTVHKFIMADESQYPLGIDGTTFSVLTTSAVDLSKMLANGTMTTSKLLPLYLNQIDRHNHKRLRLNAVISVAPLDSLKAQAAKLDAERGSGNPRWPCHGIPIFVKDNIMTEASLGMDTTYGSFNLKGVKVKRNADIVTAILEAGVLIIEKTNLSVRNKENPSFSVSNFCSGIGWKERLLAARRLVRSWRTDSDTVWRWRLCERR